MTDFRAQGWRKRQIYNLAEEEFNVYQEYRNDVIEEIAREFDEMKFGDISENFAAFIRALKK